MAMVTSFFTGMEHYMLVSCLCSFGASSACILKKVAFAILKFFTPLLLIPGLQNDPVSSVNTDFLIPEMVLHAVKLLKKIGPAISVAW